MWSRSGVVWVMGGTVGVTGVTGVTGGCWLLFVVSVERTRVGTPLVA